MASKNFVEIHVVAGDVDVYQVLDLPEGDVVPRSAVKSVLTDIIARARYQVDKQYDKKNS